MSLANFVEIGRICTINYGPDEGKLVAIVNIIDHNTALVDSPDTSRVTIGFKRLSVTGIKIRITPGARLGTLKKAWEKAKVEEEFAKSALARRLKTQATRRNLTDFERFKVMLARKQRGAAIRKEFAKLRKAKAK